MALCINDIYELKSMKKMTLLAGMGGIMNPVCSVGIADYEFADSFLEATNDDAQAFEKDSLVISSLLFAEHNPDAILPAIKFLHHTGTAGNLLVNGNDGNTACQQLLYFRIVEVNIGDHAPVQTLLYCLFHVGHVLSIRLTGI